MGNVFFNPAGQVLLYSILYYYTALVQPLFVCSRSVKSILVIMWPVTDAASSEPLPHTPTPRSWLLFSHQSVWRRLPMLLSSPHLQPKWKHLALAPSTPAAGWLFLPVL